MASLLDITKISFGLISIVITKSFARSLDITFAGLASPGN